jgi:hypothetical protein
VFFDDRYDMYPIAVNHDYTVIADVRPGWREALDRRHVEVVMAPAQSGIAQILATQAGWVTAYGDEVALVFVRRDLVAGRG